MDVILQGSLEHFRPDQLLSMLAEFHHTGVLEIRSQERAARVTFDGGALIHADGNTAGDPIAVLTDLFVWPAGSFTLSLPLQVPAGSERTTIDVGAVIRSGRALLELYPNERVRLRVLENPAPDEIHLTRDEFRVVIRLTGVRSIHQLRAELGWSANELYPLLHRLEQAGIIERLPAQDDVETVRDVDVGANETTYVPPSGPVATRAALTLPNGDVLTLVDDVYLIGRDAENRIAIDDASVSNQHARLVRNETGYMIEDAESRNGTYVNGEKLTGSRQLTNADVVRLGKVVVTFTVPGESVSL